MKNAKRFLAYFLTVAALCGCEQMDDPSTESTSPLATSSEAPSVAGAAPADLASDEAFVAGDAEVGKALVKQFECNRCHDDTGHEPVEIEQHCTHCHIGILDDTFLAAAPPDKRTKWKRNVAALLDAPSLGGAARLDPRWVEAYLLEPYDVRPHMVSNMPRLHIDEQQAKDVATYLTQARGDSPDADAAEREGASTVLAGADVIRGRELLDQRACGACHDFEGAELALRPPRPKHGEAAPPPVMMAPDLRFTRDRYRAAELIAWLEKPSDWNESTLMPPTQFSRDEARDVAAYLLTAPLELQDRPAFQRLAVLDREVPFDEVMTEVFGRTCRHCHTDPDKARGDGGTGNTGGFGFPPRRLDVSSHRALQSGLLGADGERQSAFAPLSDGTPRLLASLIARHDEEAGKPNPEVRGMPLGLPPLSAEQIQLVETWIVQGRKR